MISDKERTIVDCLRNPELCGGVRHLAHMMEEYAQLPEQNFEGIIKHAEIVANGATWKRLGYLAELLWPQNKTIFEKAKRNLTSGITKLDPAVARNGKLISKWNLWLNVIISNKDVSA